jgi:hypothetical protein
MVNLTAIMGSINMPAPLLVRIIKDILYCSKRLHKRTKQVPGPLRTNTSAKVERKAFRDRRGLMVTRYTQTRREKIAVIGVV